MDVVHSDFCGGIEISLTECRTAAAMPLLHEGNFKAKCFEHFHRGDSDMRLVIAHEGVVPEDDFASIAAVSAPGHSMSSKPAIESFARVMRQGTSSGQAEHFLHRHAQRPEIQRCIRKRWDHATDSP